MKKSIILFAFSMITISTACNLNINQTNLVDKKTMISHSYKEVDTQNIEKQKAFEKWKGKIPNVNGIKISINTGLIDENNKKTFKVESYKEVVRKRNLLGSSITNSAHTKDFNLFNPQEIETLSGFSIYDGDSLVGNDLKVSAININGKGKIEFESDVLGIAFKNQDTANLFKSKYNAKLLYNVGNTYVFKLDLTKSPSINLEKIIESFNRFLPEEITQIEFSSISSMKTFAIFADFLANNYSAIESIEFNNINHIVKRRNISDDYWNRYYGYFTSQTNNSNPNSVLKNWEVDSTGYDIAHKYSTGYGTNVAVIDHGSFGRETHPKLIDTYGKSRIDFDTKESTDVYKSDCDTFFDETNIDTKYSKYPFNINTYGLNGYYNNDCALANHPFYVSVLGFGSRGSSAFPTGTGVAPDTKITPYNIKSADFASIYWAHLVENAVNRKASAINMSFGVPHSLNSLSNFFSPIGEYISGIGATMNVQCEKAYKNNIPFLVATPDDVSIDINSTSGDNDYVSNLPHVIPVGAVSPSNTFTTFRFSSPPLNNALPNVFANNSTTRFSFFVSNFSSFSSIPNSMVYTPGDHLLVPTRNSDNNVIGFAGTSAACPVATGAVLLLKELNPSMPVDEIRDRLINASDIPVSNNTNMNALGIQSVRMLNIEKLVKDMIPNPKIDSILLGKDNQIVTKIYDGVGISISGIGLYLPGYLTFKNKLNNDEYYLILESYSDQVGGAKGSNINFTFDSYMFKDALRNSVKIPNGDYSVSFTDPDTSKISNEFDVSILPPISIKSINYNGEIIAVVDAGSKTVVTGGQKIAVPINDFIKQRLGNIYMGGAQLYLLEIVKNYAIYGIPDYNSEILVNIKNRILELVLKDTSGNTIYTLNDALKLASLAINLNPKYPDGSSLLSRSPFISDNSTNDPTKTIKIKRGETLALSITGLKNGSAIDIYSDPGDKFNVISRSNDYVVFLVDPDAALGLTNLYFNEKGSTSSLIFHNAIEILPADSTIPSSQTSDFITNSNTKVYLKFDENSGNNVVDHSGYNNTATINGNYIWNNGVKLDGVNSYLNIPNSTTLEIPNSISLEMVFSPNSEVLNSVSLANKCECRSGLYSNSSWVLFYNKDINSFELDLESGSYNSLVLFTDKQILEANKNYYIQASWDNQNKKFNFVLNGKELQVHVLQGNFPPAYPDPNSFGNINISTMPITLGATYYAYNTYEPLSFGFYSNISINKFALHSEYRTPEQGIATSQKLNLVD